MIKFIKNILSSESPESSKRLAAFLSLVAVIIMAFLATFNKNWITPEFMFDALCLIAGGGLGLTVIEKIFDKRKEVPAPVQPAPEPQPEINYDNTPTEETV